MSHMKSIEDGAPGFRRAPLELYCLANWIENDMEKSPRSSRRVPFPSVRISLVAFAPDGLLGVRSHAEHAPLLVAVQVTVASSVVGKFPLMFAKLLFMSNT